MSKFFERDLALIGRYGATPSLRVRKQYETNLRIPFEFDLTGILENGPSIGVFAHIFYPELAPEIREYLNNIPLSFDLFISTNEASKADKIQAVFEGSRAANVDVRILPNKGRDIAPFLVGFKNEIPNYDIVLHIHSKQSPHDGDLAGWRTFTFDHLLGSEKIVLSHLLTLTRTEIGLVFPDHFAPVRKSLNFGYDFDIMKSILERAGISLSKDVVLDFPSGSMFWARSKALDPILALDLRFEDFPPEEGQVDGTLAHAIERSFLFFVEKAGIGWCRSSNAKSYRNIPIYDLKGLRVAARRISRRLIGNGYGTYGQQSSIPEVMGIGVRADSNPKPRLTLLLPTLVPEKIFGGIASALRLFRSLMKDLEGTFDFRIVSCNDPVDLPCMAVVPDFQLVHLDGSGDGLEKSVIDASGRSHSQLQVRRNELFIATAWWTAADGHRFIEAQKEMFGRELPLIYLIQDHEPDFYGWSSRYGMAQSTYTRNQNMISLINSEELCEFMVSRYGLKNTFCIPYRINEKLSASLRPAPKEKLILVYGRPQTPRNGFEVLMDGLCAWQQSYPTVARDWRIVSAGESYSEDLVKHVANIEIHGKLDLEGYADVLSKASVGVSLMLSPHPSYPPLEMAEAGVQTVTNYYDHKDLSMRSPNIRSIESFSADHLARAVSNAIGSATPNIGKVVGREKIRDLRCNSPIFSSAIVAERIKEFVGKS